LAWAAFEAATTLALRRRLRHVRGLAVVIRVPTAAWVGPLHDLCETAIPGAREMFARDGTDTRKHLPTIGNDDMALALARGDAAVGISPEPERYLPSALMAATDVTIAVAPPTPAVLVRTMKLSLRGRLPRVLPEGLGARLDFPELVAALRRTGTAADAVRRLQRAVRAHVAPASAAALPPLEDAVQYGAARE